MHLFILVRQGLPEILGSQAIRRRYQQIQVAADIPKDMKDLQILHTYNFILTKTEFSNVQKLTQEVRQAMGAQNDIVEFMAPK